MRNGEGRRENAWKVGSFAAGSNDPGCIDSWGCSVVRVTDRRRERDDRGRRETGTIAREGAQNVEKQSVRENER